MLNEQEKCGVIDRIELIRSVAKHRGAKLLSSEVLNTEVSVYKFEVTFSISQENYSECINDFLAKRDDRIKKLTEKIKIRMPLEGEEIQRLEVKECKTKKIKSIPAPTAKGKVT